MGGEENPVATEAKWGGGEVLFSKRGSSENFAKPRGTLFPGKSASEIPTEEEISDKPGP